jgi:hypothetical protein
MIPVALSTDMMACSASRSCLLGAFECGDAEDSAVAELASLLTLLTTNWARR